MAADDRHRHWRRIGKEIDEKKIKATYKDGVLELTLPKAETVKPKKISVDVG